MSFTTPEDSHAHSLETLNALMQYQEFMESIENMIDVGCGKDPKDLVWWANAHILDDNGTKIPLNIDCTGIDLLPELKMSTGLKNLNYLQQDFEEVFSKQQFDLLWCHDSFQYATNPMQTLQNWWHMLNEGAMINIQLPTNINIEYNKLSCSQPSFTYFNHTIDSMIHMLAVCGFDCSDGFFQEQGKWLKVIAYKSDHEPMDPRTTSWYDLAEKELLPASAVNHINKYGFVKREGLLTKWITGSNILY